MRFSLEFHQLPAGYAAASAKRGDRVPVITREFVSTEDGNLLVSRLENLPNEIQQPFGPEHQIQPSTIKHLLAIIHPDKTGIVYINEPAQILEVRPTRSVKALEALSVSDIADVGRLRYEGIAVPPNSGVIAVLSVGWRRGLYYDLEPVAPGYSEARDYDIWEALGQYYAYLLCQHLFRISEEDWAKLFQAGWFPFRGLKHNTVRDIVVHVNSGFEFADLDERIATEVEEALPEIVEKAVRNPFVSDEVDFLRRAADRFRDGDYLSAVSVLYPRIEGALRRYYRHRDVPERATQNRLVDAVVKPSAAGSRPYSLLLPGKFADYLREVYFANFDPSAPKGISRNTVAHGVAALDQFSVRAAAAGFLVLDQLRL